MIDISQVRWAAEFDIPKSVNTIEMQNVRYCVSKLTNVKIQRWHLICRWMTLSYTMFWMNDRNSIYLREVESMYEVKVDRKLEYSMDSGFTVISQWEIHTWQDECAWVIHILKEYEQQIYYAYAIDIHIIWFDLRLSEALMYIICWVCFVCKSPVRLLTQRREFQTGWHEALEVE